MKKNKTWLVVSVIISVIISMGVLSGCGDDKLKQDVSESDATTDETAVLTNEAGDTTVVTSAVQDTTGIVSITPTPTPVPGEFFMDLDEAMFGAAAWADANGNIWFTDTGEYIGFNEMFARAG